jgi:hypothetical protein
METPNTDTMKVLTAEEIQWVSGGLSSGLAALYTPPGRIFLNPQPLPP